MHKSILYNEGAPAELVEKENPHLPTKVTIGARLPGQVVDLEPRVTKTEYDWNSTSKSFLQPTAEIVDPSGLNLKTSYQYYPTESSSPGLLKERRLPGTPGGGDARTTKTIYYSQAPNAEYSECGGKAKWANLPCKSLPAAQPTPAESNPQLPITTIAAYSNLDQPTEITEKTNGVLQRTTTKTYDAAGRPVKTKITGTGTSIPATLQHHYRPSLQAAVRLRSAGKLCRLRLPGDDDHLQRDWRGNRLRRRRRQQIDVHLQPVGTAGHGLRRQGDPDLYLRLDHRARHPAGRLGRGHLHRRLRRRRSDHRRRPAGRPHRGNDLQRGWRSRPQALPKDEQLLVELHLARFRRRRID